MKQNLIDVNLSAFPPPTPADLQKNANIFLLQIGACMSVFPSCFPLIGLYTLVFFFFSQLSLTSRMHAPKNRGR